MIKGNFILTTKDGASLYQENRGNWLYRREIANDYI